MGDLVVFSCEVHCFPDPWTGRFLGHPGEGVDPKTDHRPLSAEGLSKHADNPLSIGMPEHADNILPAFIDILRPLADKVQLGMTVSKVDGNVLFLILAEHRGEIRSYRGLLNRDNPVI